VSETSGKRRFRKESALSPRRLPRFEPVTLDPAIVRVIEREVSLLAKPIRTMTSGAGQDAQRMARFHPAARWF